MFFFFFFLKKELIFLGKLLFKMYLFYQFSLRNIAGVEVPGGVLLLLSMMTAVARGVSDSVREDAIKTSLEWRDILFSFSCLKLFY